MKTFPFCSELVFHQVENSLKILFQIQMCFILADLTKPAIAGELVVGERQTLQLQCRVEGNPANISFSWFRNRIKLNNETQNTFSVQSSNRTDSGSFSCTAENIFGKRSSESVEVRIECRLCPFAFFICSFIFSLFVKDDFVLAKLFRNFFAKGIILFLFFSFFFFEKMCSRCDECDIEIMLSLHQSLLEQKNSPDWGKWFQTFQMIKNIKTFGSTVFTFIWCVKIRATQRIKVARKLKWYEKKARK